ncbi:zinc-dependent metalloprotease [Flavobacterium lipolyticum]|uniref:T9SS type A sorting domain-containing protein n=1 Tax=Flavobacterium lipolyticum TaxID=2893754 RepID=A0ABS8M5L1_9FLAO|nr:zinc-dependent metalloprotease [Flavobacterium sp. F-126]MCC9020099.1 T9SS type A sorting domain-containing protein [Flavobacterium sp. F-126]
MKKEYIILSFIFCFSGFMYAQKSEGSGVVSYPDNNIKVVGEKEFWSANPKTDNSIESDLLTVYYKGLYNRRNNYLSGIKGTIDKPGGYIKIEVHAYDSKRAGGLQLLTNDEKTFVTRPIYNVEITQSSPNVFSKTTKEMNYEYFDYGQQIGKISSDDIKTLGAKSSNTVTVNCGGWAWNWLRAFSLVSSSCSLEIDEDKLIQLENQPVVVKITVKDATLIDVRVPAVERNDNLKRIIEKEYPYFIIKKVNAEILEAPEDNNTASYYEDLVRQQFNWANKAYTDKTGKTLPPAAVAAGAKMANARIVFKDIDITVRKGSKEIYDRDKIASGAAMANKNADGIDIKSINKNEIFIKYVPKLRNQANVFLFGTSGIWIDNSNNELVAALTVIAYSKYDSNPLIIVTLAHELGHYFGLDHTFAGGCTGPNDKISDTPASEATYLWSYKDCIAPLQCGGQRRLIENIMDYSNCRFMFTPGQVIAMRNRIRKVFPNLYTTQRSTDAGINTDLNITVKDLRPGKTGRSKRDTLEKEVEKSQDIILYPNPVKDILTISNMENEEYAIYNLTGQQILTGRTQTGQIDVSTLPNGLYIIRIKNSSKPFIKE